MYEIIQDHVKARYNKDKDSVELIDREGKTVLSAGRDLVIDMMALLPRKKKS